ncbi:hypothetical protein Hanom_Chr01g00004031 [Helianthus anomalus]
MLKCLNCFVSNRKSMFFCCLPTIYCPTFDKSARLHPLQVSPFHPRLNLRILSLLALHRPVRCSHH